MYLKLQEDFLSLPKVNSLFTFFQANGVRARAREAPPGTPVVLYNNSKEKASKCNGIICAFLHVSKNAVQAHLIAITAKRV